MSLPSGLTAYEFERVLVPSHDLAKYFHLRVETQADGTPKLLSEAASLSPISIEDFFGTVGPIEIEVGCGKGGFLVEYCERHPKRPFLGLEWESQIAFLAAGRLAKRPHLPHARIILGDAYFFFRDYLPPGSVSAFHIYFPDPWPKKRHHKNRLIRPEVMDQVFRLAQSDCHFYWGTDHAEYNLWSRDLFSQLEWLELVKDNAQPTEGIMTNFEKKYREKGKPIYRAVFRIRK